LVGQIGSGPPGVVGSPAQIAAHANVADAATTSGAQRPSGACRGWVTMGQRRSQALISIAALSGCEFSTSTTSKIP
jgi:hypothetical protein